MTLSARSTKAAPFLKWVGGKRQLLTQYRPLYPERYVNYYEPFVGGGAVFFDLEADRGQAYLSDCNAALITCYQEVRDHPGWLIAYLGRIEAEYREMDDRAREAFYYRVRTSFNSLDNSPHELAGQFIFLNRTGYNGLYRVNKAGDLNVPFGRYSNPTLCPTETLLAASTALQGVGLGVVDFAFAVKNAAFGDFVYFDPPYLPRLDQRNFRAYATTDFGPAAQLRLVACAQALTERGVQVMIANSDATPDGFYPGYRRYPIVARRVINSSGTGRGPIAEAVFLNYTPPSMV